MQQEGAGRDRANSTIIIEKEPLPRKWSKPLKENFHSAAGPPTMTGNCFSISFFLSLLDWKNLMAKNVVVSANIFLFLPKKGSSSDKSFPRGNDVQNTDGATILLEIKIIHYQSKGFFLSY